MIARLKGGLVVRDLDSALGTSVNGEPIGSHFRTDVAELRAGEIESLRAEWILTSRSQR